MTGRIDALRSSPRRSLKDTVSVMLMPISLRLIGLVTCITRRLDQSVSTRQEIISKFFCRDAHIAMYVLRLQ